MRYLFHLCPWPYPGPQVLAPSSLQNEGFVHLSTAQQLIATAQRWFVGQQTLGILVLERSALETSLVWEDTHGHGEIFPHLYAPIPEQAVSGVVRLERSPEGDFSWPETLLGLKSPIMDPPDLGEALIEPGKRFPERKLPRHAVLCCFPDVLKRLAQQPNVDRLDNLGSAVGPTPVLVLKENDWEVVVCSPGVGGPLAAVALEELVALGCERFVLCGGAGSLLADLEMGHLVLVDEATRDEGISYHYLTADATVKADSQAVERVADLLTREGVRFRQGKTWTTDALYRETPERIARRRAQGALTVEMEVASLLAVAQFRQVPLVPILYCGDDLSSETWDFRDWTSAHSVQEKLLNLALEAVRALE